MQYFLTKDEWSTSKYDWEKMNLEKEVSITVGENQYNDFVKELYLFGDNFDTTHTYRLEKVVKNGDGGRYNIEIRDLTAGTPIKICSYTAYARENGILILNETYGSGFGGMIIVDWDIVPNGTSNPYVIFNTNKISVLSNMPILKSISLVPPIPNVAYTNNNATGKKIGTLSVGSTNYDIYSNISDEDVAQISVLKQADKIRKQLDLGVINVLPSDFTYNMFYYQDGSIDITQSNRWTTDYYPVKEGDVIYWNNLQSSPTVLSLVCLGADKTTISQVTTGGAEHNPSRFNGFIINSETKWIRLTTTLTNRDNASVMIDKGVSKKAQLGIPAIYNTDYFALRNASIGNDGVLASSNRVVSALIPISGGDIIQWYHLQESMSQLSVAFYKDDKTFIDGSIYPNEYVLHNQSTSFIAPDNAAYVRFATSNTNLSTAAVTVFRNIAIEMNDANSTLLDGLAIKNKLLNRQDDITILTIGDSLTAFFNQHILDNPSVRPCQQTCDNWFGLLARYVNDIPIYANRFDSTRQVFSEIGTFDVDWKFFGQQPTGQLPYWTADGMCNETDITDGSITRKSNSSNAAVSFGWNLDNYEKMHFIHRLDYRAATSVTIAISGGNGKVQVYDEGTDAWVEANGYAFSQKIAQSAEGSGYSQTLSNWRLKFRKASGASGSVTMTFTSSGDGYFFYWGTEMWNGNRIIFVNTSKGGREAVYFNDVMLNDIAGRKPDLVIVEPMLINEFGMESGVSHSVDAVVSHINTLFFSGSLSLKTVSNNFVDFQVIAVIPNIRYEYFADEHTFAKQIGDDSTKYMDAIAPVCWNRVKKLLADNDVKYIDMMSIEKMYANQNKQTYRSIYDSKGMYSLDGLTIDTVHQNILGSKVWAANIAPIFNVK